MKRILLIIGIILAVGISYAQMNLFDLEFDAPIAATAAMLKAKGFAETARDYTKITYTAKDFPSLLALELYMNDEGTSVAHWRLEFAIASYTDVETSVMNQIKTLHGDWQYEDNFGYDYIWYLPEGKALYVRAYENDYMELNYTRGNFDDDNRNFYGRY